MTTPRATPAEPATTITAYPDGPLLLRGPAVLVDEHGEVIERRPGTVALCRCGKSSLAPFCDGTHKAALRAAVRRSRSAGGLTGPQGGRDTAVQPTSSTAKEDQ